MPQHYLPLFGLLVVWVSLPLLPAILIYRLFPESKVAVSGPLASLTFKSTGAFAAYMIVFVAITLFVQSIRDNISSRQMQLEKQYWTIDVPVQLEGADGRKINNTNAIHNFMKTLQVETTPLQHAIGTAKITLKIIPLADGAWPTVTFKMDKFLEESIDLKVVEAETKPDRFWMEVKKPITIREMLSNREAQRPSAAAAAPADEQNIR